MQLNMPERNLACIRTSRGIARWQLFLIHKECWSQLHHFFRA